LDFFEDKLKAPMSPLHIKKFHGEKGSVNIYIYDNSTQPRQQSDWENKALT
jgi:hypothetical protein